MPDLVPVVVTVEDVKNPNLLVRILRTIGDNLTYLNARISDAVAQIKSISTNFSLTSIRNSLLSTGSNPLNVQSLHGVLADPQPAGLIRYPSLPSGLPLQAIPDTQAILVKNGSTYDLYTVLGGNPSTLLKLIAGAGGGSAPDLSQMVTLNTAQTITGAKVFGDGTGAVLVAINGAAGTARDLAFETAGSLRWKIRANSTPESGGNAGSDFVLIAVDDTGTAIGSPIRITRSTMAIQIANLVNSYFGVATVGMGIPPIYDVTPLTGKTAAIGATTLYAVPASAGGIYRISYYLYITTPGNNVTLSVTLSWNDGSNSYGSTSNPVTCNAAGFAQGTIILRSAASQNITYQTNLSGAIGAGVYALDMTVERLG